MSTIALLLGFILISGILSLISTDVVNSKILNYFRVFFPSWKFFDEYRSTPTLYVREQNSNGEPSDWLQTLTYDKRSIFSVVINPWGNCRFACGSLMEQLCREVEECNNIKIESLNSYQLVINLAIYEAKKLRLAGDIQFKLELANKKGSEPFLLSPWIEVSHRI